MGEVGVRKKGPLASLVMFWRPSAHYICICSHSREAQCATLFCFMVLELDHTEVVETTHYSMEKQSLVTLDLVKACKTIKPLPWSLSALTVLSSSCQHIVRLL